MTSTDARPVDDALDPKARAAAHEAWTEHGDSLSDDALDTALRAYLAALSASLQGEAPVAWRVRERPGFMWRFVDGDPSRDPTLRDHEMQPLYAAPPPPPSLQGEAPPLSNYVHLAQLKWLNGDAENTVLSALKKWLPNIADITGTAIILDVLRSLATYVDTQEGQAAFPSKPLYAAPPPPPAFKKGYRHGVYQYFAPDAPPPPAPDGLVALLERAFDIGRSWQVTLNHDGPVRDARDVARTLGSHLFEGMSLGHDGIGLHDSRDDAIVKGVAAIKAGLRAALAPLGREGWQLVPIEPTEAMLEGFHGLNMHRDTRNYAIRTYRRMLAAAPSPVRTA